MHNQHPKQSGKLKPCTRETNEKIKIDTEKRHRNKTEKTPRWNRSRYSGQVLDTVRQFLKNPPNKVSGTVFKLLQSGFEFTTDKRKIRPRWDVDRVGAGIKLLKI